MDRESIIAAATAAYAATSGTAAQKLRGAMLEMVETLRPGHLIVSTTSGSKFLLPLAFNPETPAEPGRPAYADALAFAASMEATILAAKGTAQDPDGLTTPQLVTALKNACAAVPGLIDANDPGEVLKRVIRAAAIATVIQARLA
jgi:hypothetical protein